MSEIPTFLTTLPQPSSPPPAKPHPGRAVANGKIRFLSVSQTRQADMRSDTGCLRRWAFVKVFGKKEPQSTAQLEGVEHAKGLELYLKTGQRALKPQILAGIHLLPKVGRDLEVEAELGNVVEAAKLRDEALRTSNYEDRMRLEKEIEIVSGLSVEGIPFTGAVDLRHQRGEYVDEGGAVRAELPGYRVLEVTDHKTTGRIRDHVSASGKIYYGNAKTVDEILDDIQMLGYAKNGHIRFPDRTHARLGQIYYQTKHGLAAEKRHGLISMEEAVRRFDEKVPPIVREMIDVAGVRDANEAPGNPRACFSYGKDCPHKLYCNVPEGTVSDLFQIRKGEDMTQGLFGQLGAPTTSTTNGVAAPSAAPAQPATAGLFSAMNNPVPAPTPSASPPPPPEMDEATRQRLVEEHRQRLMAEEAAAAGSTPAMSYGYCADCGTQLGSHCASRTATGKVVHIGCTRTQTPPPATQAAPLPPPPQTASFVNAINPPDRPAPDPIAAASPLTPEAIALITDPAIRRNAEEHAAAAAARAAIEVAQTPGAKEKSTGRCPGGGERVSLTPQQAGTKKVNCPRCGKELRLKAADIAPDFSSVVLRGHIIPKAETEAPQAGQLAQLTEAIVTTALPPPPPPPPIAALPPPPPATTAPVTASFAPAATGGIKIFVSDENGRREVTQEALSAVTPPPAPLTTASAATAPATTDVSALIQRYEARVAAFERAHAEICAGLEQIVSNIRNIKL